MDACSIPGRTERLRREIELIQQEERRYRNSRGHSLAENAEHEKREFRVLAIREELRTLVEKAKEQSSHGSVWYS
jgi:type II secretory pathway component HofQ